MQKINYAGEELWLGQIGHFAILLAFVMAGFSAWSYYQARIRSDASWLRLGRYSFGVHAISIFAVIGLMFYAMFNKMYEYISVYRTVSDDSPTEYLLAAFWQDQEGSFLLWMFWHIVLGCIVMAKHRRWESSVLQTLTLVQMALTGMLLGLYMPFTAEDVKIGSNPFALIRDVFEGPIFANADYLTLVKGKGLNPLLQNYWMIIHPPVIFLGFASTLMPFTFAVAGLQSGKHKEVIPTILKWALFSGVIFGTGILMGGAWAYVALTFGGYWAWDPVENSSLVPWLFIVAGIHTNLIAKATGHSLKSTYVYYFMGFIFTLFSTFLTRSGVLGDTSVHAFTSLGLESQLTLFIGFFVLYGSYFLIRYNGQIPTTKNEEPINSREFWMFIGSLVLLLSGILMTAATSLPLFNKIVQAFDPNYVGVVLTDPIKHHNQYQLWIGVSIGLLMGSTMFLRYKAANWAIFKKSLSNYLALSVSLSLMATIFIQPHLKMFSWQHVPFLFAGLYAIIGNSTYLFSFLRSNIKQAGSVISHLGFGVLLLGIMISGLNQRVISSNPFGQGSIVEEQSAQKALLLIKNEPFFASDYWMTFEGDTLSGNLRNYIVNLKKVNTQNEVLEEHVVRPSALYQDDFTKIAAFNPGTVRKLGYDIFTAAAPLPHMQDIEIAKMEEDSLKYLSYLVSPGEFIDEPEMSMRIGDLLYDHTFTENSMITEYDLTIGLPIELRDKKRNKTHQLTVGLGLKDGVIYQFPALVNALSKKFKISDDVFEKVFSEEDELRYEDILLKQGGNVAWQGYTIVLSGFDRTPGHKNYTAQEGDIALGAQLQIESPEGKKFSLDPIFILRNAQPFSIKDYEPSEGLHIRFTNIDPANETMSFRLAKDNRIAQNVELLVASDAPRNDILIVEATIIPGINLVWLGCLMMIGGLLVALIAKHSAQNFSQPGAA